MSLGLSRNFLSFEILEGVNEETLLFFDTSQYYKVPETPIAEITPPGYTRPFFVNIVFDKINVLNSSVIGIEDFLETSCLSALPDGVWKIKYKICPYDELYVIGYHLRTTHLDKIIDKIYEGLDGSDCDVKEDVKLQKSLIDIILSKESGKAAARRGETSHSSDLYRISSDLATKLLDKVNDRCSCA